jgi:hypothetical protein
MNDEIAYALLEYIDSLDDMNKNLIKACGIELHGHATHTLRKLIFNIVQEIPRLIPYTFDQHLTKQIITNRDGLMEYRKHIPYLTHAYKQILADNYSLLDNIRKIRNTYEHQMHKNKLSSSGGGTLHLFDIKFKVDESSVSICADDFITLIRALNVLFHRLARDIIVYAENSHRQHHYYYRKATSINLLDFNTIYESSLLSKIGKIMN